MMTTDRISNRCGRLIRRFLPVLLLVLCLCGLPAGETPALLVKGLGPMTAQAAAPTLSAKTLTVVAGTKKTITLNNASAQVKWTTSDEKVAAILSAEGKSVTIRGKKAGKATITAKCAKKSYTCTVTVKNVPKISQTAASLKVGKTVELKVTGTMSAPKWKTSNAKVASLVKIGPRRYKVKALKAGTAKITAVVNGKTLVCTVKVTAVWKNYQWADKMYLTGNTENDYALEMICRKVLGKPGQSKRIQIKKLYSYVARLSTHYAEGRTNTGNKSRGWFRINFSSATVQKNVDAYAAFVKKQLSSGKARVGNGMEELSDSAMDILSDKNYCYMDCIGASCLFQELLSHIGVKCICIWGTSTAGNGHMWNAVRYGGKWYCCDVDGENWDYYMDPANKNGGLTYYRLMCGKDYLKSINYKYNAKEYPVIEKTGLKF